jgi:hypothetical protein
MANGAAISVAAAATTTAGPGRPPPLTGPRSLLLLLPGPLQVQAASGGAEAA